MEEGKDLTDQQHPDLEVMDEEDVLEVIDMEEEEGADIPMDEEEEEEEEEMNFQVEDNSSIRFTKHSQPVFCISINPKFSALTVTGGADELAYVWNSSDGQEIFKLTGHEESVTCVEFSNDGNFLATASVDGLIKVWRTLDHEKFSTWEIVSDLESTGEVTWMTWHPKGNVLLAGSSDGMSNMWQIPSGTNMQVFAGHTAMVTCGCFTPDGKSVVTASESSALIVWDPKTGQPIHKINLDEGKFKFKPEGEDSGIESLAVNRGSTICVVGGISNGGVRIINLQSGTVIAALDDHDPSSTVQVGIYEPTNPGAGVPLIISAGTDGRVCVYDASSFKLRTSMNHQAEITSLVVHKNRPRLSTGSVDRSCITWDLRTGEEVKRHLGHHDMIHQVRINSEEDKLISCSDDGSVCVFEDF